MSLSAREQHALDWIESELSDSDPDLALLLATFGRLTSGEEMPVREKIRPARWWSPRGRHRSPRQRGRVSRERDGVWTVVWSRTCRVARRLRRRLSWQTAGLLIWVLVAAGLITLAPLMHRGGHRACPVAWAACSGRAPAHPARPAWTTRG
jgi:Protein of unknown function (DUF3040)